MAWKIEVSKDARKSLRKLGKPASDRITRAIVGIAAGDNPRVRGIAMTGNYAGHWRYRVGDYRVIARLFDERVVILVVVVGHRRHVYD